MISCIMPTRNRREWLPRAFQCFADQTIPAELIVLDNGDESVADIVPSWADYYRTEPKTLGLLVNEAVEKATKSVYFAIWDDDDWYGPSRLEHQLLALGSAHVTGFNRIHFDDGARVHEYTARPGELLGNSLLFTRDFWQRNPFRAMQVGYDGAFVQAARGCITATDGRGLCVASCHAGNTAKRVIDACWRPVDRAELPAGYTLR